MFYLVGRTGRQQAVRRGRWRRRRLQPWRWLLLHELLLHERTKPGRVAQRD